MQYMHVWVRDQMMQHNVHARAWLQFLVEWRFLWRFSKADRLLFVRSGRRRKAARRLFCPDEVERLSAQLGWICWLGWVLVDWLG